MAQQRKRSSVRSTPAPVTRLKDQYGAEVPTRIAAMIRAVHADFPVEAFLADALEGYDALELMARAHKIAEALHRHLPASYAEAAQILLRSLGPKANRTEGMGLAPFLYLPHVLYVSRFGLEHFELSMRAQHELTQRFTAEFSIRAFLERYPQETLACLERWARDPNVHVRRLVSEGTRPRLPWAARLRAFQADPRPVLALLDLLKDDPELYVRRSVANNLNDIGKDHPDLLMQTARRWLQGASSERRRLVAHALRSAVKRADPHALKLLGFVPSAGVEVGRVSVSPRRAAIGESVVIAVELRNTGKRDCNVTADLRVFFVKSNGRTSVKVFKLKQLRIAARASAAIRKTISLAQLTTRTHYPGTHAIEVVLNGQVRGRARFQLIARN